MSHAHDRGGSGADLPTERFPVTDLYCVCCAESLEAALRASPHIERARVDFQNDAVEVTFHPSMISLQEIETLISQSGRCCPVGAPSTDMTHLHHRAQMAEVTAGSKQDRMQYEMPSTSAHKEHEHAHHEAKGHAGMDHDMSDPKMAEAMEKDMRNRFFVALVLTIPTVLYSPLGSDFFGLDLPSGIGNNWIALIFSTPVVWWAGWIFIGGAARSLRYRTLNMSVLISTGVLAAYLPSVVLTVAGEADTFYEAAALLVTFVLFGHWMEMKSRRGTTDALRALFDLVPPMATVLRSGEEVEVPSSEVVVGDMVVLKPGDKVPVDGVVERGETAIDESLVTEALAQADVGIAIGAGTDVAIETARVVLMKSDPLDVLRAIRLSKATVTKMKQNLFWASIYNVLAIPIAAGALYPSLGLELRPEWAALLMSLSSIIVATNAVLLKRVERDLAAG